MELNRNQTQLDDEELNVFILQFMTRTAATVRYAVVSAFTQPTELAAV